MFVFCILIVSGCTNGIKTVKEEQLKVSSNFEMTVKNAEGESITGDWIGEKEHLAITNNPFIAGKSQKYMWLFWGNQNNLVGKSFKVIASNEKGKKLTVINNYTLGGENWGAPASSPSGIEIPTKGLWGLDAYIDNKLFGTIVVDVKEK